MTNYAKLFRTLFVISLVVNIFQALPGKKYVPTPKEQQTQNATLLKELTECKTKEWKFENSKKVAGYMAVTKKRLPGETPSQYLERIRQ